MALIKPFRALRPVKRHVREVAAPPYDVMNTAEARAMAEGNPFSFLRVSRPEIDLPADLDPHDEQVYRKGRENLDRFVAEGTLVCDGQDNYYIYRQKMGTVVQTGLVACASVDDYQGGVIRKHEHTRADKEEDRVRHIDYLDANDEPVFYVYRNRPSINSLIACLTEGEPLYDFTTDDSIGHTVWAVTDRDVILRLSKEFAVIDTLYVADGHHRSAAASRVREARKGSNPGHTGMEEYNFFLTVIFPDHEMNVMAYNRAVRDLNGHSIAEFINLVGRRFDITPRRARSFLRADTTSACISRGNGTNSRQGSRRWTRTTQWGGWTSPSFRITCSARSSGCATRAPISAFISSEEAGVRRNW